MLKRQTADATLGQRAWKSRNFYAYQADQPGENPPKTVALRYNSSTFEGLRRPRGGSLQTGLDGLLRFWEAEMLLPWPET
jgi:hypothetical protein